MSHGFVQSHALVIGIDAYQAGISPLTTAVADARKIGEILEKNQGYTVQCLLDAQATKAGLLEVLERDLPQRLSPDDRLLVYFAGHGVALDGELGPEGFLLPQDTDGTRPSLLPMTQVAAAMKALPCRHLLLILDCCFAGAFRWASTRNFMPEPTVLYRRRYERFVTNRAAQVLTSAAHDQKALDKFEGLTIGKREAVAGHSPFAAALMAGLAGAADKPGPDGRPDGAITATELYAYVRDLVEQATQDHGNPQTPGLWPLPHHGRGEFVFQTDMDLRLPEDPRLLPEANPWRGLEAYGPEHSELLFGRKAVVEELVQRLQSPETTVVAVVGISGVGKTSVVRAGVLPRLKKLGWQIVEPGHPEEPPQGTDLLGGHPHDPEASPLVALREALGRARAQAGPRVLVLDQLEAVFAQCRTEKDQGTLHSLLLEAAGIKGDFRLLLVFRPETEPRLPVGLVRLAPEGEVGPARHVVPPMTRDDLRQVVVGPAEARVLYFEPPELVDTLLDDVGGLPGALPLLSQVLAELYLQAATRGEDDRGLTAADYETLGRASGCLLRRAESTFLAATPMEQRLSWRSMERMVAIEGAARVRRKVSLVELQPHTASLPGVPPDQVDAVVDQALALLLNARLIVKGPETERPLGPTYELAHEALTSWPRLVAWSEDFAHRPSMLALGQAALEWHKEGQHRGALWGDDPRLWALSELFDLSGGQLFSCSHLEVEFARASKAAVLRRRRWTRALVASILVISVTAAVVGFSLFGWAKREEALAQERRIEAEASEKKAVAALEQARIQALVAVATASPAAQAALLLRELRGKPRPEGGYEAALRLGEREAPLALLTTFERPVAGVAFSGNGLRVVAWSPPQAQVFEVGTGQVLGTLEWPGLDAAALSDDGAVLHVVNEAGKVKSFPAVGEHQIPLEGRTKAPDRTWGWPAYDPRHRLTVGRTTALPLPLLDAGADPAEFPEGRFQPRAQIALPDGFLRLRGTEAGDVTLLKFDEGGALVSSRTVPADLVLSLCGECPADMAHLVGLGLNPKGDRLAFLWGGDPRTNRAECNSICQVDQVPGGWQSGDEEPVSFDDRWATGPLSTPEGIRIHVTGVADLGVDDVDVVGCFQGKDPMDLSTFTVPLGRLEKGKSLPPTGRCRVLGGGARGALRTAEVDPAGRLTLHDAPARLIDAGSFTTTVDVHGPLLATGHVNGSVYLWSTAARWSPGFPWRANHEFAPDLRLPKDKDVAATRVADGLEVALDSPLHLPLGGQAIPEDIVSVQVSSSGRFVRAQGLFHHLVWSLPPQGPPLPVPRLSCRADPYFELAGEGVLFHPAGPTLLQHCNKPLNRQEVLVDWDILLERVDGLIRGCLTASQRESILGESPEIARQSAETCTRTPRPLPDHRAPEPWKRAPLPPVTQAPASPAARAQAEALLAEGIKRVEEDWNAAAHTFEAAVRADPSHHRARFELSVAWIRVGEFQEALEILAALKAEGQRGCAPCRAQVLEARTQETWSGYLDDSQLVEILAGVEGP